MSGHISHIRRGTVYVELEAEASIDLEELVEELDKDDREKLCGLLRVEQQEDANELFRLAYQALVGGRQNDAIAFLERALFPSDKIKLPMKSDTTTKASAP